MVKLMSFLSRRGGGVVLKLIPLNLGIILLIIDGTLMVGQTNSSHSLPSVYFTQDVDTTYASSGINAISLHSIVFDTLAAYISRAVLSIDIAQYEYETWVGDPIYSAINLAFARGVKIRFLQDGGRTSGNSGVNLLDTAIPRFSSPLPGPAPCGGFYNIMHNKFLIIDEDHPDSNHCFVWTGSLDWNQNMGMGDYNNVIVVQSKQLARVYLQEFNMMWGDSIHGGGPNQANAKFGPCKDSTRSHEFLIKGSKVELYFSPTDSLNNHILNLLSEANSDLYCGMFTFTLNNDANEIVQMRNAGAKTFVILDHYGSGSYAPYNSIFPSALATEFTGFVSPNFIYHNKYLVVNPASLCEDPRVLTGSHNWTFSANTKNDENTLIIHNDTIANIYYQAFVNDFYVISGNHPMSVGNSCTTTIPSTNRIVAGGLAFPNPSCGSFSLKMTEMVKELTLRDLGGKLLYYKATFYPLNEKVNVCFLSQGMYLLEGQTERGFFREKICIRSAR